MCSGVARGENGTAILIREHRCIKSPEFSRKRDYLFLIHAYERLENRHGDHRLCGSHRLHGLRGDLAEILSGNYRLGSVIVCYTLRDPHHEPSHNEGEILLRALFAYLLLNAGKGYYFYRQFTAVVLKNMRKFEYFFLGCFRSIREREEMNGYYFDPSFGYHICRHRAVYASGQQ